MGGGWREGGCCFLLLGGIVCGLVVSIYLKENLPVVNINYLLMTYYFKGQRTNLDICFKNNNCVVNLSLMPTSMIILATLKSFKPIIYLSLLLF